VSDSAATWFYARNGQQTGPVTLAELKGMAASGSLNPRHDMVWSEGMKDWQPAGEVAGIFERKTVPEPAAPATPAPAAVPDPYAPPATIGADDDMLQQATWPGVRRRSYILIAIVMPILVQIGAALMVPLMLRNQPPPCCLARCW